MVREPRTPPSWDGRERRYSASGTPARGDWRQVDRRREAPLRRPRDGGGARRVARRPRLRLLVACLTVTLLVAGAGVSLGAIPGEGSTLLSRARALLMLDGSVQGAAPSAETMDPQDQPMALEAAPAAPAPTATATVTGPPVRAVQAVPPVPVIPARASGRFTALAVPALAAQRGGGRVVTYSVEVENGLDVDRAEFAATVADVLADARGWQTHDGVCRRPVSPGKAASADIRVTLASPGTTDSLCAPLKTGGEVSCWNGERSVLNYKRWVLGASSYGDDLTGYRTYLISHEVGHGLGHAHETCPAKGKPAPIMLQQTLSLRGCTAWPWPVR